MLLLLLAFAAGCILTGLFFHQWRSGTIRELDRRYTAEHSRAAETIGRLTEELGRERELNRELRDHNSRARAIAAGLAESSNRTVRNLQDAIGLICEIRKKLKVLEDVYSNSYTGSGAP